MISNLLIFSFPRWSYSCMIQKRLSSDKVRSLTICISFQRVNVKWQLLMRIVKIHSFKFSAQVLTLVRLHSSRARTEERQPSKQRTTVTLAISPVKHSTKSWPSSPRSKTQWSKILSSIRISIDAGRNSCCWILITLEIWALRLTKRLSSTFKVRCSRLATKSSNKPNTTIKYTYWSTVKSNYSSSSNRRTLRLRISRREAASWIRLTVWLWTRLHTVQGLSTRLLYLPFLCKISKTLCSEGRI